MIKKDIVIIGAGPAGLAAAIRAHNNGADVLVLERNPRAGGILNQCIHDGFGAERFGELLSGPEYVGRFEAEAAALGIEVRCSAMVLRITPDKQVTYVTQGAMETVQAGAVILATGCRERTRGAIAIPGTRPAGVYTAGVVQHLVNVQNIAVGKRAVVLGSGDIGLIMARRLTLEGVEVVCVLEKLPYCSGLARNVRQCLDDYGIPLYLSTTVTEIRGREHLSSVMVSAFDEQGRPIPGTEREIPCDLLILSVGLIPENELAKACGVQMDPATNGALVDGSLMTTVPGIFSCGNCLHVHDLVDNVSAEAEYAADRACAFIRGEAAPAQLPVELGDGIRYVLPRTLNKDAEAVLSLRVRDIGRNKYVIAASEVLPQPRYGAAERTSSVKKRMARLTPAEMIRLKVPAATTPLKLELVSIPGAKDTGDGDLICTSCPNGCGLYVQKAEDGKLQVTGNLCPKGEQFALEELTAPMRTLTTCVPVENGTLRMMPLRSAMKIPKPQMRAAVSQLRGLSLAAPLKAGDRVTLGGIEFILGTDA